MQINYSILEVLMRRDGMTEEEAKEYIAEAKQMVAEGASPEEILHYEFGLEPDYMFDLM
jgi:hypothetical protein